MLDGFIYCRASYRQFLDSQLGRSDDRVVRVVVLLEAEGLSAERVLDFLAFALEPSKFAVVLVPVARDGLGEVELQQAKAIRAEQAPTHEVDERVDHRVLLDAERARVADRVGRGAAAVRLEAAAIPV